VYIANLYATNLQFTKELISGSVEAVKNNLFMLYDFFNEQGVVLEMIIDTSNTLHYDS